MDINYCNNCTYTLFKGVGGILSMESQKENKMLIASCFASYKVIADNHTINIFIFESTFLKNTKRQVLRY